MSGYAGPMKMLGLCQGDVFVDLFPGSGAVWAAWKAYVAQERMNFDTEVA